MLEKIFEQVNSELLTDEVKLQMEVIFESALNEAIENKVKELEEEHETKLKEFEKTLIEKLDEYIDYFVEDFLKENEKNLEDKVKVEKANEIINLFKETVSNFGIKIEGGTIEENVELKELKEKYNELVNENLELKNKFKEIEKMKIVDEVAEELKIESNKERFKELAKAIEFINEEEFKTKINELKETFKENKETKTIKEGYQPNEGKEFINENVDTDIQKYLKYFS